jgi:hypothetical protein
MILDDTWKVAMTGPRSSDFPCDPDLLSLVIIAQVIGGIESQNISLYDNLTLILTDSNDEETINFQVKTLSLLCSEVMKSSIGDLRPTLITCLRSILHLIHTSQSLPLLRSLDHSLTDYVKKGGDLLRSFSQDITKAYLSLLEKSRGLYGLSLWLGRCVEYGFTSLDQITLIAQTCIDHSVKDINTAEGIQKSITVYALQRVVLFCNHTHPELCLPLYLIIYQNLPLQSTANYDVIGYTANCRGVEIIKDCCSIENPALMMEISRFVEKLMEEDRGYVGEDEMKYLAEVFSKGNKEEES